MKDNAVAPTMGPSGNIAPKFYSGWFLYFMLMIAVVGTAFAYVLSMPFFCWAAFGAPHICSAGEFLESESRL